MITKEQLLKPKRRVVEVELHEFSEPIRLLEPSGLVAMQFREFLQGGGKADSADGLIRIVRAIVADPDNQPALSSDEEARQFLEGLSFKSVAILLEQYTEFTVAKKKDSTAVPSEPSPSV